MHPPSASGDASGLPVAMSSGARSGLPVAMSSGARSGRAASVVPPRVSVVIPTLNEARNLPHVFATLPADLHEVIVVDGRSTDDTIAVARALRPDARILTQPGRGKGDALRHGFNAATGDLVVMLDADGSTNGIEIPQFVAALQSNVDMAKGTRFAPGGGSGDITLSRHLGNRAFNLLVNALYGAQFTDLCYGYNAFWRRCLIHIDIDCDGFEVETLINIRAVKAGLRIREVPSYEAPRLHGASNLNAWRDGRRVLATIVREWTPRRRRPAATRDARRGTAPPVDGHPIGERRRPGERRNGDSERNALLGGVLSSSPRTEEEEQGA